MNELKNLGTFIGLVGAAVISFIAVLHLSDMHLRPRIAERTAPPSRDRAVPLQWDGTAIAGASKSSKIRIAKAPPPSAPKGDANDRTSPLLPDGDGIVAVANAAPLRPRIAARTAIGILQLGDSHTAADFFTGVLRRMLQERYGDGGSGYMIVGRPHVGVRSDTIKVTDTGWTYEALQKSTDTTDFALSGFNAVVEGEGKTLTFVADHPLPSDIWEVEALRQPGGGGIDILVDGIVKRSVNLDGAASEHLLISMPVRLGTQRLTITTTKPGDVSIASVANYNRAKGLIYHSVGFPGATIDILNKFDEKIFTAELRRLAPQIVVLAFGSNEGFNDNLDLDRYAKNYALAAAKIRYALPRAIIVIVGPPDGGRKPTSASAGPCPWQTPAKLNGVRDVQRELAREQNLVYWNWASIMPLECGAHQWAQKTPPLMAKDHLHFSRDGYKQSAEQFLSVLIPTIEKIRAQVDVVSNN
jgi:lysophospholipase L1-like esterase